MRPVLLLLGLAAACRSPGDGGEKRAVQPPAPVPASDSGGPGAATAPTVREHMGDHFGAVTRLQRALMRDELALARDQATYLIEHAAHEGPGDWQPYVDAMRFGARQVEEAPDVVIAAGASAFLALQCSRCHTEHDVVASFPPVEPPRADGTVDARMERHRWAVERMWQGVTGPSPPGWLEGAEALTAADLEALVADSITLDGDARALIARVRELARRATAADSAESRAVVYGELLATCAACHRMVRDPQGVHPGRD